MLVLRSRNHTFTYIQSSRMLSTKPYARHIAKMYDLVRTASSFFNLLKVDMFLNPIEIEPAQAAANKYLLYTPEGEVLDEFHMLPHMNTSFIILDVGYPMNGYWEKLRDAFLFDYVFTLLHIHFTNIMSLHTGLLKTVSTLFHL